MDAIVRKIFNLVQERKISKEEAKEMLKELQGHSLQTNQDIAVIGMAGRFPQAENIEEFWDNLIQGRNCISLFPESRREDTDPIVKGYLGEQSFEPGKIYKTGGYLRHAALFDAGFFRISPREAQTMEPVQRLFLEVAWEAIENAGLAGERLVGSNTGVFVGRDHSSESIYKKLVPEADTLVVTGSWTGILASRISYIFDFQGPSVVIDTACSSGLVAVHEACQALKLKECDLAIAGGVCLETLATRSDRLAMVESSDWTIRSFDKHANGTTWGEGVGAVLLKPLKKALVDGDSIHAVIRGSATNNDGASNGITAPKAEAQEQVILKAWQDAQIHPETITYVEAHGTGTILGDPIEIKGLTQAFRQYTEKRQFCGIGSCKTSIGHLVGASGIASFIKMALCVKHGIIPPSLNFQEPNPYIDFCDSPVYVTDQLREWKTEGYPRRGGVSAYGFSGTNCHIVVEEPPIQESPLDETEPQIVAISARSGEILHTFVRRYRQWVTEHPEMHLADFCYTINTGRGHFTHRLVLRVADRDELLEKLQQIEQTGLHHDPDHFIFYGEHRVVNASKQDREPGEITEAERRELTGDGVRHLQHFVRTGDGITSVAQAYVLGADLHWDELYAGQERRRLHLPAYPFERNRYWVQNPKTVLDEGVPMTTKRPEKEIAHPLLDRCLADSIYQKIYLTTFSVERHWLLQDHKVLGNYVVPGTTYIELIREVMKKYFPDWSFELSDFYFMTPLMVNKEEPREVQTVLQGQGGRFEFTIASKDEFSEEWVIHAQGKILPCEKLEKMKYDLEPLKASFFTVQELEPKEIKGAFELGPRWANFRRIYFGENEVLVFITIQDQFRDDLKEFLIHPALMDIAVNAFSQSLGEGVYLPFNYQSLKLYGPMPERFYSYMRKDNRQTESTEMFSANITLMDESGQIFAEITDYTVKKVRVSDLKAKKNLYYGIHWCEQPLRDAAMRPLADQAVLILHDERKLGEAIAEALRAEGCRIFEAGYGERFTDLGDGRYMITGSEADYQNLFSQLKDQALSMILHLASITECTDVRGLSDMAEFQKRGVKSLFYIARAVSKAKMRDSVELILITEGVNPVPGRETIYPHNASLAGLGKVIGQEIQNLHVHVIDLEPRAMNLTETDTDRKNPARIVLEEIKASNRPYQVSYRAGKRYVEEIERLKPDELPAIERVMHADGIYLITGGTGGIGLEVARYLASQNRVNLALFHRTPLPMRAHWDEILQQGDNEKLCRQLQAIRAIESTGARVITCAANVDSYEEMESQIGQLRETYGRINGVVHAAGVAGDGFLLRKEEVVFDGVLAPKMQGTWILDQLTRRDHPDFFILCSSISSCVASAGQGDYVAANSYLDAYAAWRTQAGLPTISINWAAWKETGMAVEYKVNADAGIFKGLTTMQAMTAFEEILEHQLQRIIVGELNYQHALFAHIEQFPVNLTKELKETAAKAFRRTQTNQSPAKTKLRRKAVTMKGRTDGKYTSIEKDLAAIWGEVLDIDTVDIYEDFYALGGDSIIAIKLTNAIKSMGGIKVDTSDIFEYQTIAAFAAYLEQQQSLQGAREAAATQKADEEQQVKSFPLSNTQQRIWFLQQYNPGMTAYNLPTITKLEEDLDLEVFQAAVNVMIQRHSALRTIFIEEEGIPRQMVLPEAVLPVEVVDLRLEANPEEVFERLIQAENNNVFDLSQLLIKVKVYRIRKEYTNLYLNMHHIITDGWSITIIAQELIALYRSALGGKAFALPPVPIQYEDWLETQEAWLRSSECREAEDYWLLEMQKPLPVLNLPIDLPRPHEKTYQGTYLHCWIDPETTRQIKVRVKQQGTTMHIFLLSAYSLLLQKMTQDEDLIIGIPIAGRDQQELERVVGLFINMLPIRIRFGSLQTFADLLGAVKEKSMCAYKYGKYPFDLLVNRLNPERDASRSPIFSTVFQFSAFVAHAQDGISLYDLSIDCQEKNGEITVKFEYCTDLFNRETMEQMAESYIRVLRQVCENPEIELPNVTVISEAVQKQLLEEFNATDREYPRDKTLHQLFAEQAARTPARTALVFEEEEMSYGELNARTDQLAYRLRKLGIARDEVVGVMAERSIAMVIGILGVLKSGGAYMPIDPDYPIERIQHMVRDSGARTVLLQDGLVDPMLFDSVLIRITERNTGSPTEGIANINQPTDLAYVMYTSGSTGKPKGVMVEHRSVVNLSTYYNELFRLDQEQHILHMSNVSFDTSVVEIFPPLIFGSTVYIIRKELALDREGLLHYIEQNHVHFAQFVPMTLWEILGHAPKPASLASVIVGGDILDDAVKDRILSLGYRLTNHYGPTESTVDAVVAVCEKGKTTIGRPIANTRAYILGKDGQPTPLGVPGELCISGAGLARGYLNRPELTAERFIPNPWMPGERMYRTGDLAKWCSDGTITFCGRMDHQVKIRGYRIEPDEIEQHLLTLNGITQAVVTDRLDPGGHKYLCAYVVADHETTAAACRAHLAKVLPDYMIPAHFIQIEQIPLTYNGKVDRRALLAMEGSLDAGVEMAAPTNERERRLVELWKEVLDLPEIGIQHNFFTMGGHSLKAMTLIAKIQKEWNVKIPFSIIFKHPTIQKLAQYLERAEQSPYSEIQPVGGRAYYPLSSSQRRIYIQWQLAAHSRAYNMTSTHILEGTLDRRRLEKAIQGLVEQHEALRTSFAVVQGEPVQIIRPQAEIPVDYREAKEDELKELVDQAIQPYDLSKAPLFRIMLVQFAPDRYLLLFDMHHIISDGISLSILTRDFVSLYEEADLTPLRVQYKDYAVWHNTLMESPVMEQLSQYWMKQLEGFTYTELPASTAASSEQIQGGMLHAHLDQDMTRRIQEFCQRHQMTRFAFIFGVFQFILMKTIQQDDLTVGIPVAGRSQEEMKKVMGVFLNVLMIRTKVEKDIPFCDYLVQVSNALMEAQEYQEYPYEALYGRVKERWNLRQNSLFSILFNYMPYEREDGSELKEVTIRPYPLQEIEPKYGLTLYVSEGKDDIGFHAVFQSNLDETWVRIILNSFSPVIETVLEQEGMLLKDISLLEDRYFERYMEDFTVEFDNDELF